MFPLKNFKVSKAKKNEIYSSHKKFNLTNIRFDYHLAIRPYNINEYINKHYKNYYFLL